MARIWIRCGPNCVCVCVWANAKSGAAEQEVVSAEVNEVKARRELDLKDGERRSAVSVASLAESLEMNLSQ